jgi:C4-dicarboxylate-binding protein DctP
MNRRNPTSLILTALFLLALAACGSDRHVFKYGNAQNKSDPRSESMEFFKEELEKRTEGRIEVENYFGGILGTEREMADAVATGALQGTRGGMFEDASIRFNIVLLPFLVDNWEQAICLVHSPWMTEVAEEARAKGLHIPAVGISQGFRAHGSNERPIRALEDFAGLKIRVPDAQEVFHRMEDALGANPQGIAQSETYSALRTGVIEGTTAPPSDLWDRRQYEVLQWITIDSHATGPDPLMVNLSWYESLPLDLQRIFDEVAREALELSDQLYSSSEEEIIASLDQEVEIIRPDEVVLAELKQQTRSVYDFFVERGDFSWDDINAAIAAAHSCDDPQIEN